MQSRKTQITMVKWTNAGGQTKRANEQSFVYRPPAWRRWRNVKTTVSEPACSSQFNLQWAGPHLRRNATHLRTFCFLRSYFCLWRDFSQPACPSAARFTLKTALNSHEECNEYADLICFKDHHYESFCLSVYSLSCATRSLDLCILFNFIFLYLWYIPPHSCVFYTLCLHLQFFIYILPCGIFFLTLLMPLIGDSSEFNFNF